MRRRRARSRKPVQSASMAPVPKKAFSHMTSSPTNHRDVWIVMAAYNEATRLSHTLEALSERYANIVVVDDGSSDDTSRVAADHPVWRLRHTVNCGQGAALQTGIDFALSRGAEILVTFDADGQHSPADVERLCEPLRSGQYDVVLGSRFLGEAVGLPWSRWLILKLGVVFTRVVSRVHVTDTHNGLRALSRHAASQIRLTQNRMAHASEMLDELRRQGLRYREVPVTIRYSTGTLAKGQNTWNGLRIVGQFIAGKFIR